MKTCTQCMKAKDDDNFGWKNKKKGKRRSICKKCQSEYHSGWYKANRERHAANVARNNKKYITENRRKIFEYLLCHPCIDCGEADPIVLDFDHIGRKVRNISIMIRHIASWANVEAEIKKCVVRCANCHRRRTAKQFKWISRTVRC